MNDALMVGVVLTLVFGAVIFFLYNRLSMTERKMGLIEGVLTDLKIMMDSAPFATGSGPDRMEFEPSPDYLNAISGPIPLQKDEVEEVIPEDYDQAVNLGAEGQGQGQGQAQGYRNLQIDELTSTLANPVVTKLSPDLEAMTVKELHGLAKQKGVSVPAGTRRKDLIELLKGGVEGLPIPTQDLPGQGSLLSSFDQDEKVSSL
jgi:hypothetical protein